MLKAQSVSPQTPEITETTRSKIRKHALVNASSHEGKAQSKIVLSRILGEMPQLRTMVGQVSAVVEEIVSEVNNLPLGDQNRLVAEQWPEMALKKSPKPEEKALSPLPNVEKYPRIVTRFSPNPDCVLHLGSARAAILSNEYARIYNGSFLLRFEDTDPRIKKPVIEFYKKIREDLRWLGCTWSQEFIQSDRLPIYYEHVEKLLEMGNAYVCNCSQEDFRRNATAGIACPCRDQPLENNLERWSKMFENSADEGSAVVRVKTNLTHPNPAVREWPAMRIIDTKKTPHPLVGSKYRVWPLYNLSTGLDDHLMGVTHIIRGKEHLTNEARQRFMYSHFGWEYPEAIHYGRLRIAGASLSKSRIKVGVESKLYKGYDDPRLATFLALRRRGIAPDAIRTMMVEVGSKAHDIQLSREALYTYNRRLIDPSSARYFFVRKPINLVINHLRETVVARVHVHPDHPERGERVFKLEPKNDIASLWISRDDIKALMPQTVVRLIGLCNIEIDEINENVVKAKFHSISHEEGKMVRAPLIQYVTQPGVHMRVIMPNAKKAEGLAEISCKKLEANQVIQLERFGFVRIDKVQEEEILAFYAHK